MMKTGIILAFSLTLISCAEKEWTEGFLTGGFHEGHSTTVKYNIGGPTTFRVSIESEAYQELLYPISMNVLLNGQSCSLSTLQETKEPLLLSTTCSSNLGPGTHVYVVEISNPNNFKNFTRDNDIQLNSITGSITYTLEENL